MRCYFFKYRGVSELPDISVLNIEYMLVDDVNFIFLSSKTNGVHSISL
jgi:hypothetical protein